MSGTQNCRGGIIQIQKDGVLYEAKGDCEYNLGHPKRETIVGSDSPHGFKTIPQESYIQCATTDRGTLDVGALLDSEDVTITLTTASGKVIVWRNAWYSADGKITTAEGEIEFKFSSAKQAEEV